jgi:two-component system, LuxR family, response regulator FixJ
VSETVSAEPTAPLVLIVDDDEAVGRSTAFLLASVGLEARAFERADAFLAAYPDGDSGRPGCIVMDVRMPGMSGLELQRVLADRGCALPIIVVTGHGDVPMAVAALKAGAHDFIEKPFKEQHLLDLVEGAIRLSRRNIAVADRHHAIEEKIDSLGKREREVMERVLEGKANKVIAFELGLSIKTVEVYRASLMDKMDVHSLAELAHLVAEHRLKSGEGGA